MIDPLHFRRTLGRFCSGIVVLTTMDEGRPAGMSCQSFISVSLDPPLVGFAPAMTSRTYEAIRRTGHFCVNVLSESQRNLCANFARSDADRWQGIAWSPSGTGSPVLEGVLAWIDCRVEAEHQTGDHYFVTGRVLDLHGGDDRPLLYFNGDYGALHHGDLAA